MMSNRRSSITIRTVDALKPGDLVWDTQVKRFGVRCQRRDKVYFVKARVAGRQRWFTIGPHGSPWTPDKARDKARSILGDIADDVDLAAIRKERKAVITVAELAEVFLVEYAEAKKKASTAHQYRDLIERLALPTLGKMSVPAVTHQDIARLHNNLKRTPRQANYVLAVVSKLFAWAETNGHRKRDTNPCRDVEKFPERSRERFLSETEIGRLAEVLTEAEASGTENPFVVACIRLLIFTGGRVSEIKNLRWEHVDFERAMLFLPDSKTGRKPIFLSAPALDILANIPRIVDNPYVICGQVPGAALVNLRKPWTRIRRAAGLEGVRIHDLRHSYASFGAAGGLSLPIIGRLLGHTKSSTTEKYSHLAANPLREANEAIGERIAAMMRGNTNGAEIIELKRNS